MIEEHHSMTFKPATWFPIATVLSVVNVAAVAVAGAPWHATTHAVLAVAFGLWAQHLRHARPGGELQSGLEALEDEMSNLRRELNEAQERLDFAERVMAQGAEVRRVEPEH
jgi:hypothetical protein